MNTTLPLLAFAVWLSLALMQCSETPKAQQGETPAVAANQPPAVIETHGLGKAWLSEYGFFVGEMADLSPAKQVVPYTLNTPLFTDYAHKARFIYLPEGSQMTWQDREVFDFPVGAVIIKNFYYPDDFQQPNGKRKILETRLLVREEKGWQPLSYIWNEEQTDAYFKLTGHTADVRYQDEAGAVQQVRYQVPNLNQCKSCHLRDKAVVPIGPTARQLNREEPLKGNNVNQLAYLVDRGWLTGHPSPQKWPKLAVWDDVASGTLDERARAYLDINCGHCHRPEGPAKTSGLDLTAFHQDAYQLGIRKPPVAAGKASGDLQFDIVPGHPDASILAFRMAHTDPGIMMPELGRSVVHREGVALIREWIEKM